VPVVKSFKDSLAWQACRELYKITYNYTKEFPKDEMFGLISQIRRAANSAASNIAEGFGRQTKADKLHFYIMARGSITELQNHAQLAFDVNLLTQEKLAKLDEQSSLAHKLVVGLIK
jgi:four helix bundle protein